MSKLINSISDEIIVVYAVPLFVGHEQKVVFFGVRDENNLFQIVNNIPIGETGFAYAINNEGTVVGD